MVKVFNDNVEITMTIGDEKWYLSEARVENSRISTPDYVQLKRMIPSESDPKTVANNKNEYLGKPFELIADNQIVSKRNAGREKDSLLFKGHLANLSAAGDQTFEGIAYNPSHQPFGAINQEQSDSEQSDSEQSNSEQSSGSVLNKTYSLTTESYERENVSSLEKGTEYFETVKRAKTIITNILKEEFSLNASSDRVNIRLKEGGYSDVENYPTMGKNSRLVLTDKNRTIKEIFDQVREQTKSEWWFDKDGTFNFGAFPKPPKHKLRFITDTTAGINTPPYQSVIVIGSGVTSVEGNARVSMQAENRITEMGTIVGDRVVTDVSSREELNNPVFRYTNLEISTNEQAKNTADTILRDLKEQQKDGKITVTGFPEVEPLDVVEVPDSRRQPMGGEEYTVYKVVHKLNNSDGFKTEITTAGLTDITNYVRDEQ